MKSMLTMLVCCECKKGRGKITCNAKGHDLICDNCGDRPFKGTLSKKDTEYVRGFYPEWIAETEIPPFRSRLKGDDDDNSGSN